MKSRLILAALAAVLITATAVVTVGAGTGAPAENDGYDIEIIESGGNEYVIFRLNRRTGVVVGTEVEVEDDGEEFEWTGWRKFELERGTDRENMKLMKKEMDK